MSTQIYLAGTDVPVWITEPADAVVYRVEEASPSDFLVFTTICCHGEGEEPSYEERTAFMRADQIAYITPLGPRAREHLAEAREARP